MRDLIRSLRRSALGTIGIGLLALILLTALCAPLLGLADPVSSSLLVRLQPPTWDGWFNPGPHPFGTDQVGRDVLSRVIYGSRSTLLIAGVAVIAGGCIGVLLGIIAGWFGGIADRIIMRVVDLQLALPLLLLALLVVAALGAGMTNLIIVLALTSWVRYARIIRGQVLAIREREFILSARAIGAGTMRIMALHILPNVATPALIVATLELARVILMDAALSFLGLGVQPPQPSWGRMLADGRTYIASAWWLVTFPGIAIVLMVLAVNLTGDWLRDHFDPRQRSQR